MQGTQRIRLGIASIAFAAASWSIPGIGVAQRAPTCSSGTLPSGAPYLIQASQDWNAHTDALVVLAHGYRFPQDPVEPLTADPALTSWLGGLNVAIAAVNYRKSGLAIKEGAADIEELLELFVNDSQACGYGRPARAWLVGASEGGLIATLVAERQAARAQPHIDGVVAACGPVGDFRLQLEYITDFRVVFNVLFPGAIPGSAVAIPPDVVAAWDTVYAPAVRELVMSQPEQMQRLLRVTGAPVDSTDPASVETTVLTLLRYNVAATNEAVQTLGGVPVDNSARVYAGSGDPALDALVNASAERFTAQPVAVAELEAFYRTSGALQQAANGGSNIPVVTIHTTGDPLVPYAHEPIYLSKTLAAGAGDWHLNIPVERYGHCSFTPIEIVGALTAVRILPITHSSLPTLRPKASSD